MRFCLLFLVAVVLLPVVGRSQQDSVRSRPANRQNTPQDSAYHLNAGTSSLKEIAGERVLELKSGVRIRHGSTTITSDEGRQYTARRLTLLIGSVNIDDKELHMEGDEGEYRRAEDQATLRGNVKIVDNDWTVWCDRAVFYRGTDQAWLIGNVVAADSASRLQADSVFYDQARQTVEAYGDVTVSNPQEGIRVHGQHGLFFRDQSEAVIDRFPRMIIDPKSDEPTAVDADTMFFYPNHDRAVASGRVKIVKGNMITQCDSAVVVDSEKRAELYGEPLAQQDNVSMKANQMNLHYNDEEVNKIALLGEAIIREVPRDTLIVDRDSWVQGDSMELYLHDNRLDSISVRGQAISEYYPQSVDRVESNYVRGQEMFFVFSNDSLSSVGVVGDADGVYRYVDLEKGQTADSLRSVKDTSLVYVPFEQEAEKVVYSADSIQYYARERDMVLNGTGKIIYRDRTLLATNIKYNSNLQLMDATGSPVLIEGAEKLRGSQMGYDLDTGVGLVKDGATKFIQGYYQGDDIAKVGDNVLKVWNSTYTTCDRKVPHYHFAANQMKVYLDDKVVTGPIVLYIAETPVFVLPFFAQNIRQGRRSGILRPDFEFGITGSGDRFIRNIGYYWATNDYMDFTIIGDFNENSRLQARLDNRYKLRYHFDGGFNYRWLRRLTDDTKEWTVAARHSQVFRGGYNFSTNLSFVSSDEAPREVNNIDQVQDVINRNIRSTARLSKNWEGIIGFSASADRQQYLNVTRPNAVKLNMTLPDVRLSIPSRTLYFGEKTTRGDRSFWQAVLDGIRFSPGLDFRRTFVERTIGAPGVIINPPDTVPVSTTDIITSNQSVGFSSPTKVGFINISPTLAARNNYTRTVTKIDDYLDTLIVPGVRTLVRGSEVSVSDNVFNWNFGAAASSNFYGTFYPTIGILTGLRHRISPTANYSFVPAQNGRPRSQGFAVGLTNAIDLKVKDEKTDQERKLSNVVIWSLRSSYRPDAASKEGWAAIGSNVNTQIYGVNISMNNSIDPYEWEVKSTQLTSNFAFRGTHGLGSAEESEKTELNVIAASDTSTLGQATGTTDGGIEDPERKGLPWSIRAALSYSKIKGFEPSSTLNLGGNINLTRNWIITYNASYNVETRQIQGQNYTIRRDLHAWEMSLSRQQLGDRWEFYFRITLKAHPELYAEQGPRGLAGGGAIPGQYSY
jgi:lipopolysaccharide assembly outer membrane protein LptD (OstA)